MLKASAFPDSGIRLSLGNFVVSRLGYIYLVMCLFVRDSFTNIQRKERNIQRIHSITDLYLLYSSPQSVRDETFARLYHNSL